MKTNYFNLSYANDSEQERAFLKVSVLGSLQHAAFAAGDVVFDWVSIDIPRGTSRILGATSILRSRGNDAATAQPTGIDFIFSRGTAEGAAPATIGVANDEAMLTPNNDIIGVLPAVDANIVGTAQVVVTSTAASPLVVEQHAHHPIHGTVSAGAGIQPHQTKLYVAGIAAGAIDFRSLARVNETGFGAGEQSVITTDGTDPRQMFIQGDVLVAHDDAAIGTLKTADSATQITLSLANTDIIADSDFIYNKFPIRFALHCSK